MFSLNSVGAYAASSCTVLYLDSGNITISDSGSYVITQHDSGAQTHTVTVTSGAPDIVIKNINIDVSNTTDACAFSIAIGAAVNLTLEGTNTLKSGQNRAGLEVAGDGIGQPDTTNSAALSITPQSTGSLAVTGGHEAAGIGGGCTAGDTYGSGGIITISGGAITAAGGPSGAGVGGGLAGNAGAITINGGMVTAVAGSYAAGIGGGQVGIVGTITINSGIVSATGDYGGAGIGTGYGGGAGPVLHADITISINGGAVTAAGGKFAAGIGNSNDFSGGVVDITGGTVTATSGADGAGIGCANGYVTISGVDTQVTAKAQGYGFDLGCGYACTPAQNLKISDGATVKLAGNGNTNTAAFVHTECQIISNAGAALKYNSSGTSSPVTLLTAAVTALPVKNGVKLTASVSPDQAGTFTFSYQGEKDSGVFADSVPITNGKATAIWNNPSEGTSIISAKYHDASGQYDALKAQYQYVSGSETTDLSTVHSSGFGYTYAGNTIILMDGGYYIFTGSTTSNKIVVPNGVSAGVTLKDASIRVSADNDCAFSIGKGASLSLTLKGNNTLQSGMDCAGLQVPGDTTAPTDPTKNAFLTITSQSDGSLSATSPGGAGIGGGKNGTGGTVTITGTGTNVTAQGQDGGMDIGGGKGGNGGTLCVAGTGLDNGPEITLLSNGTNDVNPSGSNPQFMFCTIDGIGAKDASGTDIHGCYDSNGKIRLSVTLSTPAAAKVGVPVLLTATVLRYYFNDAVAFAPENIRFTDAGTTKLCDSVSIATNVTAQTMWTPTRTTGYQLMASYIPNVLSRYAKTDSNIIDYAPGKFTPVVSALPTASPVTAGTLLSDSTLSGGSMADANGRTVSGTFAWANPNDKAATTSNYYTAIFIPSDTDNYNAVAGIMVPVTVTAAAGKSHSSNTSAPTLPASVTDTSTGVQIDLSGAVFPSWVTRVSLSASPLALGTADQEGSTVYHLAISQTGLNMIGSPFVYNIQLLDQNGNPITFTGSVTVKIPVPAGICGTPHVFRYEESTGTFTDLGATVQDQSLVFTTTHFSYYVVGGTGDSVKLDTKTYQMPVGGQYRIGMKLTGSKAATVDVYSTNDKVAAVTKLRDGNIQVTGKSSGTVWIMFDVYDSKNKLLTHVSTRVDVKTGIRPKGDSTRQIGIF